MRDTKREIIRFWFEETEPQLWFQVSDSFDQQIRDRYLVSYNMAVDGLCDAWTADADGCLALCILLDQFPRNMFRGTARAFATDEKALITAKLAVSKGFDKLLPPIKRRFLYLPYEHSEELRDQTKCVELFEAMKADDPLGHEYAVRHKEVIEKFGRFPHRNEALGRDSTPEEEAYLKENGGF